jgi:regulator of sigma E protease
VTWLRIVQVAVALGLLIFVHELGHFLAAKWAGVRVEVFSFGFGPFLLSFKKGDTIYAVSLIPFGGYVRMTGQADVGRVTEHDKVVPHSYMAKSPGKRAIIIVAGVTMNVIFAYFVFIPALLFGFHDVPTQIGEVDEGSPAFDAGLRPGDRVLEVAGRRVSRWHRLDSVVATSKGGQPLEIVYRRGQEPEPQTTTVYPKGGSIRASDSIGIRPPQQDVPIAIGALRGMGLGVEEVTKGSPGDGAGLRPYDYIANVDGEAFDGLNGFRKALNRADGGAVTLTVLRGDKRFDVAVVPQKSADGSYIVGFRPSEDVVAQVQRDSPAFAAGMKRGDFITKVAHPLESNWAEVTWKRADGTKSSATLTFQENALAYQLRYYEHQLIQSDLAGVWVDAADEMRWAISTTVDVLGGLLRGLVPLRHVSGFLQIVATTYEFTKSGIGHYLWLIAVISVNLAVINLFPMAPLDGGLLAFLTYEAIRGKPANPRIQETAQMVGAVLLLLLIVVVTKNDISRLFF